MFSFLFAIFESRLFMPIIISLAIGGIYTTGFVKGNNYCVAKQAKVEQKLEQKHDKIKTNVDNLPDPALDKRLLKFRRD